MNHRFLELDLLRSLAILLMVIYHLAYDLEFFYHQNLGIPDHPAWIVFERCTAGLFLLLVGCSFAISWNRHHGKHPDAPFRKRYRKYLKRSLGVIACGMLVSIATYIVDPETYVRFGILHLIGVSILLLPFFANLREWNAVLGIVTIGLGNGLPFDTLRAFGGLGTVNTNLLLPFGWMPPDFFSVDYFPLIPWFGAVLIGYSIGYYFYVRGKLPIFSIFNFQFLAGHSSRKSDGWSILSWPGRNALLIYLLHQPILLGILGLVASLKIL